MHYALAAHEYFITDLRIGRLRFESNTSRMKIDVRNYRFLIPVLKHIKQYRRMITHRASESVYCTTERR